MVAAPASHERAPSSGRGRVVARRGPDGRTVVASSHATSPLRLLASPFPYMRGAAVCMVTFGGGLVGGDLIEVEVVVEPGASLLLFTQASTKVFRGASAQHLRAEVAGTLVLLPDPVAAFADARYTQRIDVALSGSEASCVVLDAMTSGRAAFGERWAMNALDLRTRVTHDGRTVLSDALRLDVAAGPIPERMATYEAFATLSAVGTSALPVAEAILAEAVVPPTPELAIARSRLARAPGAIARFAAASPSAALSAVRACLTSLPALDVADPFGARH